VLANRRRAVVNVDLAKISRVAGPATVADEAIHLIRTHSGVLTRVGRAFIDIGVTCVVGPRRPESIDTDALEAVSAAIVTRAAILRG
jgi:hypothetical protein